MTFSIWLWTRRQLLLTLLGAFVAAIAAGAAIGFAGASLTRDDSASRTAGRATDPSGDSQRTDARVAPGFSGVSVRIVSAILHPAGTARGRRRQRARLSVHARVTNSSDSAVALGSPRLRSDVRLLGIDAQAIQAAGALLRPLRAGSTADGVLRYETAGPLTRRLTTTRRGALRIAGRTMRLNIKVGRPANPTSDASRPTSGS